MKKLLLTCSALVFALSLWAQERIVSGKVSSSEDGSNLPGVNVVLKGTTNGTVTDSEGRYSVSISGADPILVFSFIGLTTQEVAVGQRSVVDVELAQDVKQLTEVVVTSLGMEREKKSLGYSVATVSGDNIAQRSEPDPLRALQGKMPGVNITGGGGAPGQSTKINIRGMSSFTGNTQPLFVVDGIPFDNSVNGGDPSGAATSGQNTVFSNRAFDLDPNNIESISVLKGAAASALYGSRATNGVVIVTTKAGKKSTRKGVEVTYNGSLNFEELSGVPDYQDVYTQGSNQVYNGTFIGNWGAPFPNHVDDINAKYGTNYSKVYGAYPDGQPYPEGFAPNPINLYNPNVFPEFVQQYTRTDNGQVVNVSAPYAVAPHDNVGGFFERGKMWENAIQISSGGERANINAGFSRMDQRGIIPNATADRTTLSFGGNGELANGLSISGTVNYVNTNQQSPQSGGSAFTDYFGQTGSTGSIFARLFYLPRNFDLNGLPFENPVNGNNIFYRALDNPHWIAKYNLYTSKVNRVFGNMTAGYDVTPWLNLLFKGGVNTYSEARRNIVRNGGSSLPLGEVYTEDITNTEQDYNFIATIDKGIGENFNVTAVMGINANQRELSRRRVTGTGIISTGLNLTDATSTQIVNYDYNMLRRLYGVYGDIRLSYKDYLFLNLVGRNDWSSTLPEANNSYFYPGVSLSAVISEMVTLPSVITFLKARVSATKVGNDASPYLVNSVYNIVTPFTSSAGAVSNMATLSRTLGNQNLKPEFTTEYEGGVEARFLQDRIGLDLTYFSRVSTSQIAYADVARSSGFSREVVNIGELTNKGWEVGLDLTPVSTASGFRWNIYLAYTRIRSEIVDAGPTGEIIVGGPSSSGVLSTIHRNGYPYGQIYGSKYTYADDGTLLIDPNTGLPFLAPESTIVGNPNPDFTLGFNNTFSFKGFTLRALVDWKQGGEFYSFTGASLLLRGMLANSVEREALRVVPGYLGNVQTGQPIMGDDGNPARNTIPITAFDSHFSNGWGAYGADEVNIYDGTVIRLREVSLGYSIPKSFLAKTPFGSASISISGRNLWFSAPNVLNGLNLDPEMLAETADSNVQGFEYGTTPTVRRYGVNLTLTF